MPLIQSESKPKSQVTMPAVPAIRQLWQQANLGDQEALAKVRGMLEGHPDVWRQLGNLSQLAERALIQQLAKCDPLLAEAAEQQANELRRELLGNRPSRLLKSAVDRVVTTGLAINVTDVLASLADPNSTNARFWSQQQERQQRRHANALRMLEITLRIERADTKSHRP